MQHMTKTRWGPGPVRSSGHGLTRAYLRLRVKPEHRAAILTEYPIFFLVYSSPRCGCIKFGTSSCPEGSNDHDHNLLPFTVCIRQPWVHELLSAGCSRLFNGKIWYSVALVLSGHWHAVSAVSYYHDHRRTNGYCRIPCLGHTPPFPFNWSQRELPNHIVGTSRRTIAKPTTETSTSCAAYCA
jgi:hypothetical protein